MPERLAKIVIRNDMTLSAPEASRETLGSLLEITCQRL